MIPHRMLSNEISSRGLKDRVSACRKRLRENRVMLKAQASTSFEELFPETRVHTSPFRHAEPRDSGTLRLFEEQEVGVT